MHRRRSRPTTPARLAAAAALLAALTACSGEPEPVIEQGPSQTPTPSDPTATPTVEPEAESAKAFIRRWQAEAFAMQKSGDTSTYRELTHGCSGCDSFANQVETIYRGGGTIEMSDARVDSIFQVGQSSGTQIFEFEVVSSPTLVRDAAGQVTQDLAGGRVRFQVNLERRSGAWSVARISELV